jgi:hypothetical protein
MNHETIKMHNVGDDGEGCIELVSRSDDYDGERHWYFVAYNEGGYNCTRVDVVDALNWLKEHKPELLEENGLAILGDY